jgi:hypothetical protein
VAAGLVLAAASTGALVSCGGSDGSGSTSVASFCQAYNSLYTAFAETDPDDPAGVVRVLKSWAKRMDAVGAPDDLPADAQRGLTRLIETASGLDDDATEADLAALDATFSSAQKKDGTALQTWAAENCPDPFEAPAGPASGTDSP